MMQIKPIRTMNEIITPLKNRLFTRYIILFKSNLFLFSSCNSEMPMVDDFRDYFGDFYPENIGKDELVALHSKLEQSTQISFYYIDKNTVIKSKKRISAAHLLSLLKKESVYTTKRRPYLLERKSKIHNLCKSTTCIKLDHPRCICEMNDKFCFVAILENSAPFYCFITLDMDDTIKLTRHFFPKLVKTVQASQRTWFCN